MGFLGRFRPSPPVRFSSGNRGFSGVKGLNLQRFLKQRWLPAHSRVIVRPLSGSTHTPDRAILHASRRRNDGLARVFHDLKLMEREGSGFDLMYERLLASGRGAPTPSEGPDSVHVVVPRRILHPGVIWFLGEADRKFSLSQREKIALGLLAPTEGLSAVELAERLELNSPPEVGRWQERLINLGLVQQAGRTKATRYFVPPDLLKASGLDHQTTLKRVSPHRLRALVLEDLERYPDSAISDIHRRIGSEIAQRTIKRALDQLTLGDRVKPSGENRGRTYQLAPDINLPPKGGR